MHLIMTGGKGKGQQAGLTLRAFHIFRKLKRMNWVETTTVGEVAHYTCHEERPITHYIMPL